MWGDFFGLVYSIVKKVLVLNNRFLTAELINTYKKNLFGESGWYYGLYPAVENSFGAVSHVRILPSTFYASLDHFNINFSLRHFPEVLLFIKERGGKKSALMPTYPKKYPIYKFSRWLRRKIKSRINAVVLSRT
jgi:hypothetical protein